MKPNAKIYVRALITVFILLVYIPAAFYNTHFLDDDQYLLVSSLGGGYENLKKIWVEVGNPTTLAGYYQPITLTTFWLEGLNNGWVSSTTLSRIGNIFLHLCNALLLYKLAGYFSQARQTVTILVVLIFAFHPISVDTTLWLAQRKTLLAVFFIMISTVCITKFLLQGSKNSFLFLAACAAFVLSLISKPTGVALPLLLFATLQTLSHVSTRSTLYITAPFLAISIASCVVTVFSQSRSGTLYSTGDYNEFVQLISAIGISVSNVFLPFQNSPHYDHMNYSDVSVYTILGVSVIPAFLILLLKFRQERHGILLLVIAFLCLLAPTVDIFGYSEALIAGHFFYPFIAFFSIVLLRFGFFQGYARAGKALPWILLAAICGASIDVYRSWMSSEALYSRAIKLNPTSAVLSRNLGGVHLSNGELHAAELGFRNALQLRGDMPEAILGLGIVSYRKGELSQAITYFEIATLADRNLKQAYYNLALVLRDLEMYESATEAMNKYLDQSTPGVDDRLFQMQLLWESGRRLQAVELSLELAKNKPLVADFSSYAGTFLFAMGDLERAEFYLNQAISLGSKSLNDVENLKTIQRHLQGER